MRFVVAIVLLYLAPIGLWAQDKAVLIDEFSRMQCGEFMARMDIIVAQSEQFPNSTVYLRYYGERYRRTLVQKGEITKLDYPHREDGLNWAKAIPLFLTTYPSYSEQKREFFKKNIVMVDGGFRETVDVEIWFVPKGAELPDATPAIDAKDIRFRTDSPLSVRNYTGCYDSY